MKNLYTIYLLILLLPLSAFSQNQMPDIETQLTQAMSQLDYSALQTGIHIDRIPAYIPVSIYDGTASPDSLKVNWKALHLLYGMLLQSQVNAFPLLPMDSLPDKWSSMENQDTTVFGAIYCAYDRFKPSAMDSNLISFDNPFFHTVAGASSPFEQSQIFVASPADPIRYGLQQTVFFNSEWMFTNQPNPWQTLEVDVDDGLGWRTITPNDILAINYPFQGVKHWQTRVTLPSGDILLSVSTMDIRVSENIQNLMTRGFLKTPDETINIPIGADPINWNIWVNTKDDCGKDYWEKIDLDLPAGLTAEIFYNQDCETPALRKPLFLVNGFDPARSHTWEFVMGENGILEAAYDDPSNPPQNLSDHLHDEKYDIIYVSFSDATGDIRTNAFWLRMLISEVNRLKAEAGSTEKNVVIGASMGGLVSKWALLSIQNDGVDHETELFMTVDSPLRGANVALGYQAMIKDLAQTKVAFTPLSDIMPSLKYGVETLSSKGAQQMLYYNWMTAGCTYCNGNNLDNEHKAFFDELESMGILEVPHIGLSNGSINGIGNNIKPSDHLLEYDDFKDLLIAKASPCLKQGAPINPTTFKLEIDVWASPGCSGYFNPYVGKLSGVVYYKKTFAHILGVDWVSAAVYKVDNITSWDNAPGGLRSFNSKNDNGEEVKDMPWLKKSFCFIPTVSALDIGGADPFYTGYNLQDVEENVENGNTTLRSYVGAVEQSANQFWEEQTNQEHVSFDRRTANFTKSLLKTLRFPTDYNPLTTRIFNFGKIGISSVDPQSAIPMNTRNIIDFDLSILSIGQLWINRDDRIGFTDVTENPHNIGKEVYDVHVKPAFCDGSDVEVKVVDGGLIRIGHVGTPNEGQLIMHPHTSLLVNNAGSVILEKGYDNNLILQGGHMTINQGGEVDARWGSRILIQEGSTLTVKSGGKLFIKQYSSLEVENGGKLILEPGAEIYLWDGPTPNGKATIHIHDGGELEWQGDIQFTGNGFFQFDAGNIFTPLTDWNLAGMGTNFRMIRLNNNATLKVTGVNMYLSDGGIEFEQGSSLDHYLGENRLEKVTFYGASSQTGFGMNNYNPFKVYIDQCHFVNLETGYNVSQYTGTNPDFLLKNSLFENCVNGMLAGPASWVTLDQTTFNDCITGIYAKDVKYAYLNDCIIQGNSTNEDIGAFLEDTPVFRMHGGLMDELDYGIQVLGEANQSNVFLYSQATISNCTQGIYIEHGGVNTNGLDYGMVLIDCANLINNNEGVIGEDILLQVDAINNATHRPNQTISPNTFINGANPYTFDDIFQICYIQRDADVVYARQNVWENGEPDPITDFDNHDVNSSNGCTFKFNKVDNMIWNPVAEFIVDCPLPPRTPGYTDNGGLTQPPIFGSTETCIIDGGASSTLLHDQWARGWERFYAEDLDGASTWLNPVASVPNTMRDTMSSSCRKYIDQARVLTNAIATIQGNSPAKPGGISDSFKQSNWNEDPSENGLSELFVSPNPARDVIQIRLDNQSPFHYRIISTMGMLMQDGSLQTHLSVDVHTWPEGMYEVQLTDGFGKTVNHARFMVAK